MSFLPKYLAFAVIGTAVVYCAAPFATKKLLAQQPDSPPPNYQPSLPEERGETPHLQNGRGQDARAPREGDTTASEERGGTPHLQNGRGQDARAPRAGDTTASEERGETPHLQNGRGQDARAPRAGDTPTQNEPEVIVENVRGYTPSTDVIRPSGNDVKYWGVSIVDTALYDRDGKVRQEKLPGGTLIEQTDAKSSSIGEMAICRVWLKGQWAGSFLVSTADLIRFDGGREEVDAQDVANLCHYYALAAIVERRKEDLKQKAASANPYYAELKRKATAYNANVKRAEELTAKRDQAKGAERTKIIAELTKLKNSESREAAEVKQLTQKYEEWKKSHPATGSSQGADRDPVIQGYERQMGELKGRLEMFGI